MEIRPISNSAKHYGWNDYYRRSIFGPLSGVTYSSNATNTLRNNEAGLYADRMRQRGLEPKAFNRNLARDAHLIAENFKASGGEFTEVKFTESPQGKHDEEAWRKRFAENIVFLFPPN